MSLLNIQEVLSSEAYQALPVLRLAVLRNVVVEPIEMYLKYFMSQLGFQVSCYFGNYDNIFQEAVGGASDFLSDQLEVVLVIPKLENLSWKLAREFAGLSTETIDRERKEIMSFVEQVVKGIRRQTNATIVWFGFEGPTFPALGVLDHQAGVTQSRVIQELNYDIRKVLSAGVNRYFIDMTILLGRIGKREFFDQRYWHIGRAPYSKKALQEMAGEVQKIVRALRGKQKKCLVLDCDNVLWGGIIGEDGLSGIQLGKDYPGSPYYEFQLEVFNLIQRGVIVALCSKNNERDVWEVFEQHSDMVLRKDHISSFQINWYDKAANIREIALDLNIGLDSMVFIDDSEFEIDLVQQELPEVTTLHFDPKRAVEYRERLAECGLFDVVTLSQEDKARYKSYQEERNRKALKNEMTDLDSYYRHLEMAVDIRLCDGLSLPRVAQLTQKTNQFNLTTRRYTENDIEAFVQSENYDVLYMRVQDRFGDMGIVGVGIIKYFEQKAEIDTFLLSCRAIGRTVEKVFLEQCLTRARYRGCTEVLGEFIPTSKNAQVQEFFPQQGFTQIQVSGGVRQFHLDLRKDRPSTGDYFKEIRSDVKPE